MTETVLKNPRKQVISNARAIRGALEECLKLADQIHDAELKAEAMAFVNSMEYLAALLLRERRRVQRQTPQPELMAKLREEVAHIRQLVIENEQISHQLNDGEAKE